ncbi:hypothetical protein H70357_32350 [Paenibacillus sp. FSL H7-0357]|uniref:class I SAM-dependent methyltransferase n=1 Tax=Paenibacillus sp. FSL H7-0357 TaxID=1536774 RepID=UPI0004F7FC0B|nr:class I SAM-dependent methyltransferase [Paenibacillus sp. FSL H7-0357]AIQ20838.1 hypothetical protein H70357_32350 [Paenibacillus sp. FSL H7-0357]
MKYNVDLDISVGTSHSLILNKIKRNSKVLEFGSASGYMTKYMKEELGCEIVCIEIDAEAAEKARKYADLMIVADIENDPWFQKISEFTFDFILFADVLEHLRNPEVILKQATSLLNNDGIVLTSVPNISHNAIIMELMQGRFDYRSTGLLDDTHVHFFTRKSLLELLDDCGLEPSEWLTTMRRPETTEFQQKYSDFPILVQHYLENRLDGDVYQFVTMSRKKKSDENPLDFTYRQHINYLDLDHCQLYWGEDSSFNELSSIQVPVVFNNDFKTYSFDIPLGVKGNLRLDPANTPVYGAIRGVKLFEITSSGTRREVNPDNTKITSQLKPLNNIYKLADERDFRFFATNNDPSIYIEGISLNGNLKYILEVEMQINNSIEEIITKLSHEMKDNELEIVNLSKENQTYSEETNVLLAREKELLDKNMAWNETYSDLNNQFAELKETYKLLDENHKTIIKQNEEKSLEYISNLRDKEILIEELRKEISLMKYSFSWRSTAFFRKMANKIRGK